jgi:cell division protease FtsH
MSNPPPNKPGNWGRLSKTLAFWILVLLVPVAFIQFSSARTDGVEKIE